MEGKENEVVHRVEHTFAEPIHVQCKRSWPKEDLSEIHRTGMTKEDIEQMIKRSIYDGIIHELIKHDLVEILQVEEPYDLSNSSPMVHFWGKLLVKRPSTKEYSLKNAGSFSDLEKYQRGRSKH